MRPLRRQEMLANSDGNDTIPQLHAYGRYIGTSNISTALSIDIFSSSSCNKTKQTTINSPITTGTAEEVQELEDWGELDYLLRGEKPPPPVIPQQ